MFKKLLSCVREYKLHSILAPIFVTCEVIMEVFIPFMLAWLIDNGINKGDMNYIIKLGIVLVLSAIISLVFGALSGRSAAIASAGFAKNLRHDMFHRVQSFSFTNIDKFSSSSIVTRLTTDVTNVQNAYQMIIRVAVRSPVMLVSAMVMAFNTNSKLAFVFFACVPVLAIGMYVIISGAHPIFKRVFKIYDKLNNVVQENLRGIRVVKSYVREKHETEKFKNISGTIFGLFTKVEKRMAYTSPLMQFCVYTCLLCISWFGAKLIVASGNNAELGMTTGQLMSFVSYMTQILMSLMMLSMIVVMLVISRTSAERIVEILSEEPSMTSPENAVLEVADGSVEYKNVSFSYSGDEEHSVLKNINLSVKSGETVGIIGGTGSAKSTFVSLISRLYDVTDGQILVGGRDVREYDMETIRNAVAVVLQKNVLFSGTIKDNLRWGKQDATDEEMVRVCKLACADEFISSFPDGYDTYIEQGGSNVSGGQKQRLCIARALLKHPKILILDDSTSAVDTKTDALIQRAFASEIPETTKFIIAQRISSVMHADKIVVLDNGEINGVGTHDELLRTNKIYGEVYYSQVKGGEDDE